MRGIQNLKALIALAIVTAQQLSTIDEDKNKKVSLAEAIRAITTIGFKIPAVFNALAEVNEEWKDLTPAELDELVKWFALEFDLPALEHSKIEAIVKKVVAIIVSNYNHYRDLKELLA